MIGHEAHGGSFAALAAYLERGDDGLQEGRIAWHESRNVWAPTVRDAASVMSVMAGASSTTTPVYHLSVSFDPADPVDRALMVRVADRLLEDLGLGEHQAVVVAHRDRAHAHVHLMVNRVHPRTGRVWKLDFSRREIERSLRRQERELGLRENPGHLFRLPGQERPDRSVSLGAGMLRREERTGEAPFVERARSALAGDFARATSYAELEARLAATGHWIEARPRGLVVTDGSGYAAVSSVSPTASRDKLERRFGQTFDEYLAARGPGQPGAGAAREHAGRGPGEPGDPAGRDAGHPGARETGEHGATGAGEPGHPVGRDPGRPAAGPDGGGRSAGRGERPGTPGSPAAPGDGAGAAGSGAVAGGGDRDADGDGRAADRGGRADGDGGGAGGDLRAPGAGEDRSRGVPGADAGGVGVGGPADGGGAGQLGRRRRPDGEEVRGGAPDQPGEAGAAAPAGGATADAGAGAGGGAVEAVGGAGGYAGGRGAGAREARRVEAVGDGGGRVPGGDPDAHAPAARLDDEPGAAHGAPGGGGGDLHLRRGEPDGARGDAAGEPLAGAWAPRLDGGAGAGEAVAAARPRYTLYEDEGVFGVFDAVGPQVFFAESRERAVDEVRRANEIVARFPATISMRHLREMDAAWRAERGLPSLPEPEGRRIVVPAAASQGAVAVAPVTAAPLPHDAVRRHVAPAVEAGSGAPSAPAPSPSPSAVSSVIQTASGVSFRRALRLRVENAQTDLRRTTLLAEDLSSATAAADRALARLRAALGGLYGDHAAAAETGFRRMVQEQGPGPAVAALRADPRSLLPAPRPRLLAGGTAARAQAAEQAAACAPLVERLDRTLTEACGHIGLAPPPDPVSDGELRRTVLDRLRELAPAQRALVDDALGDYRRGAGSLPTPRQLRGEIARLTPPQREAVRAAVPGLAELLQPARAAALRRGGPGL